MAERSIAQLAHLTLDADGEALLPIPGRWNAALTVVAGVVGDSGHLDPAGTAVFDRDGDAIRASSEPGAEMVVMAGRPLDEPVAMGGGFVMSDRAEVAIAMSDYRAGRMGHLTATG